MNYVLGEKNTFKNGKRKIKNYFEIQECLGFFHSFTVEGLDP